MRPGCLVVRISRDQARAWLAGQIGDVDLVKAPGRGDGFWVASIQGRGGLRRLGLYPAAWPAAKWAVYRTGVDQVKRFLAPYGPRAGIAEASGQVRWLLEGEGYARLAARLSRRRR